MRRAWATPSTTLASLIVAALAAMLLPFGPASGRLHSAIPTAAT